MVPPEALSVLAEVAHGGLPVLPAHHIGDTQVHREKSRQDEEGTFKTNGIILRQLFGGFQYVIPLQGRQGPSRGHVERVVGKAVRFFQHSEWIGGRAAILDQKFIKPTAHRKHLFEAAFSGRINRARGARL
ncbi:hypothetical protein D3C75_872240 [compost metagenome]